MRDMTYNPHQLRGQPKNKAQFRASDNGLPESALPSDPADDLKARFAWADDAIIQRILSSTYDGPRVELRPGWESDYIDEDDENYAGNDGVTCKHCGDHVISNFERAGRLAHQSTESIHCLSAEDLAGDSLMYRNLAATHPAGSTKYGELCSKADLAEESANKLAEAGRL